MKLNWKPNTLGEQVVFYSVCVPLMAPAWLHSRVLVEGMMTLDALIVVVVAGLMVTRRGVC